MDLLFDTLTQDLLPSEAAVIKNDPSAVTYLETLRHLSAGDAGDEFDKEAQYLETSYNNNVKTLATLAEGGHRQFLSAAKNLSGFEQEYKSFSASSSKAAELKIDAEIPAQGNQRDTPALLLRNIDKVSEILELPTLTRACVTNGLYSEALDIVGHAKLLSSRYPNIKIIQKLLQEVLSVQSLLVNELLAQLTKSVKLPQIIKTISYLKRLPPFSDLASATESTRALHQVFFASRIAYIKSQLADIPHKDASDKYLKRYIEIVREHAFATITNFRLTFTDSGNESAGEFLRCIVLQLSQQLDEHLPNLNETQTANIWLQLAYCSQSMGRVGGEFGQVLVGLVKDENAEKEWSAAVEKQKEISISIA